MKKIIIALAALGALTIIPSLALAESIGNFEADIAIHSDATIRVTETIEYDFGDAVRHGIERDIPDRYQARGGNFTLQISDITVTDPSGQPYRFSVTDSGNDKKIKIGDPNTTLSGPHTYVIGYTVGRAVNYFNDHDELYWNVTGNGWQAPMQNVSAQITLPAGGAFSQTACFAGPAGATDSCTGSGAPGSASTVFQQTSLNPGDGLTIVAGFPKGLVSQPTFWQNLLAILGDNWGLGLPLLALVAMIFLWYAKGRDLGGSKSVVAQYEPPQNVTPTEVGAIIDERAGNQDISAEIINLAVAGYVKITQLQEKALLLFNKTDYQLDLLKNYSDLPNQFERTMAQALFGTSSSVKLSSLKDKFYSDLTTIRKQVYQSVVDKGFFAKNPNTVRTWYAVGGGALAFLGIFLAAYAQNVYTLAGMVLSGAIVGVFGFFMPRTTAAGTDMKNYINGLKLYMSVAEKDRLKFFNAPDKTPQHFEKLLPYALALGVETSWAKQFEGIYNTPPSWYYGQPGGAFNALYFAGAMHRFSQTTNQAMTSRPSSAAGGRSGFGGGSSGGGFGGGGGGSW